jgi:hypothetical protein
VDPRPPIFALWVEVSTFTVSDVPGARLALTSVDVIVIWPAAGVTAARPSRLKSRKQKQRFMAHLLR